MVKPELPVQPKDHEPNPFVAEYLSEEQTRPLLIFSRESQSEKLLEAFNATKTNESFLVKSIKYSSVKYAFNALEKNKFIKATDYKIITRGAKDEERKIYIIRLK